MALVTLLVLALTSSTVFYFIANRYQAAFQSASWNEALIVAESGVDTALQAYNTSTASPSTAWAGWTPSDATTFPKTYSGVLPAHAGSGNNKMYISVTVDKTLTDSSGNIWPRITSSGTTEVPGLPRVGYAASVLSLTGVKNHNNMLRKIAMKSDVTGGALHLPQVTRTVQVVGRPLATGIFKRAVVTKNSMTMSGGAYTDSFDSTNSAKSTNGQYDQTKRQSHGDVATNITGNSSNLQSSYVYGNAWSNGGTIQNTSNVQGKVYNNFSTTISSVSDPSFSSFVSSPNTINNPNAPVTLTAGTSAAPTNYILSQLTVSNSANPLILAPPVAGQSSYINIWVKGDMTTSGSGYILQQQGVHATFWVDGKVTVSGSAINNTNGMASYLTVNGVTAANGSTNTYTVSGSGTFIGVVNAPSYAFTLSGSGDFSGAFIMYSMNISGAAGFHYDESLAGNSGSNGLSYEIASWVENVK